MTQIFAKRPELMPIGETTQEHKRWQEEEAALVEKDRVATGSKGGLFRGSFRLTRRRQLAVIRDDEDGVDRCPACAWELEDGMCTRCEYPAGENSAETSDSDGQAPWIDPYNMDVASMEDLVDAFGDEGLMDGRIPDSDFTEHEYSSEDGSLVGSTPRMRHRDGRITARLNRLQAHPEEEPNYDTFFDDTDEDNEDEEAGSLDDFVVNDVENGPHSVTSSTENLRWETDEGTDREANHPQGSDIGQDSQDEDGYNETTFAVAQYDPEDESDEGPILRSRRQARQRPVASQQSSGSDGSGGSGVSQALNALRVRNEDNGGRVSAHAHRNIPHRNADTRGERTADDPIEIESDSDSPVSAQHAWRRTRAIRNRPLSDNDSDVEASSGTATVGRDSPGPIADWIRRRSEGIRMGRHSSDASSPTATETSPTRPIDGHLAVPGAFPQRSQLHSWLDTNNSQHSSRTPARANRGETNSFRDTSTRPLPTDASPSNGLQQRRGTRRRSPFPPRARHRSLTPTQSHSPTAMEMFEQGKRERQAQKIERRAERRRLKAEREHRGRPQSGLSLSPGSSN